MPAVPLSQQQIRDGLRSIYNLDTDQFTYSIPDSDSVPDPTNFWEFDPDPLTPPQINYSNNATVGQRQPITDYSVLSGPQAANFVLALETWDDLIAPDFQEVADDAGSHGEVRVAFTSYNMTGFAGYAFQGSNQTPNSIVGDVWLNSDDTGDSYDVGTNDFSTMIHEMGHVLGLKHSFEGTTIPDPYETTRYSVMSYTDAGLLVTFSGAFNGPIQSSTVPVATVTPMVLDIAAVQELYGVDPDTNLGDTVYTFDQDDAFLQSIYDAGGTDTFNLAGIDRPNIIDLTPGAYSSVAVYPVADQIAYWQGQYNPAFAAFIAGEFSDPNTYAWNDNVGIAFNTTIENVTGGTNNDIIIGNAAVNVLIGGEGNDLLDGAAGNDALTGGAGNDTYYVDALGDTITEADGFGTDRVAADATYTLAAGISIELFDAEHSTATTAIDLTGNELAQTIIGNAGNNLISGGAGNDTLIGLGGVDTLNGNAGNDVMIGRSGGSGTMNGGTEDDTFYVLDPDEVVGEAPGEGTDRVATSGSYTLTAGQEIERLDAINLTDTTALNLTGNEYGQTIIGNAGINTLNGGDGADVLFSFTANDILNGDGGDDILMGDGGDDAMTGGTGNDTYILEQAGDTITETSGEGIDRVSTAITFTLGAGISVERIEAVTLGAGTAMNLTGNEIGNIFAGNAGVNVIDGKGGNDVMYGAGGADTFRFTTALDAFNNVDQIEDMASGSDEIELDDAVFAALTAGALAAGAFNTGLLGVATEADDRIIYDTVTGALYYDADGSALGSSAVQFAVLAGAPSLAAGDFTVI